MSAAHASVCWNANYLQCLFTCCGEISLLVSKMFNFWQLLISGLVTVHRCRNEIKVLLYSRWGISFLKKDGEDRNKRFDAFVLYNRHDYRFVFEEMLPKYVSLSKKYFTVSAFPVNPIKCGLIFPNSSRALLETSY